jgi:hypothetical protein
VYEFCLDFLLAAGDGHGHGYFCVAFFIHPRQGNIMCVGCGMLYTACCQRLGLRIERCLLACGGYDLLDVVNAASDDLRRLAGLPLTPYLPSFGST